MRRLNLAIRKGFINDLYILASFINTNKRVLICAFVYGNRHDNPENLQ